DIHIDVPAVNYKEMRSTKESESSACILERVIRAREIQLTRLSSGREKLYCNAQMPTQLIRKFCELSADCERLLERAMAQQGLSARAHDRILKVARTIADLDGIPQLEPKHIAEGKIADAPEKQKPRNPYGFSRLTLCLCGRSWVLLRASPPPLRFSTPHP